MIFVVDDDVIMAECVRRACLINGEYDGEVKIFGDGVAMMGAIGGGMPELIFLDMMLTGPDGLAVLHELASYEDTAKVPVVLMSGLDLGGADFVEYGVVKVLNKGEMTPEEIGGIVRGVMVGRKAAESSSDEVMAERAVEAVAEGDSEAEVGR